MREEEKNLGLTLFTMVIQIAQEIGHESLPELGIHFHILYRNKTTGGPIRRHKESEVLRYATHVSAYVC